MRNIIKTSNKNSYLCRMKKVFLFVFISCLVCLIGKTQPTTALDFKMTDCAAGQMHHLYNELDSGKVVIMEFFMTNCQACIDAGNLLEPLYQNLKTSCGTKILFYQTAFDDSYKCGTINTWVNGNGYSSVPFDSGAAQIAYYGFFGMPTVAVAAGPTHDLLFLKISGGFTTADTGAIGISIRNYCATLSATETGTGFVFSVFPNPAREKINLFFTGTDPVPFSAELINTLGQKVRTFSIPGTGSLPFEMEISLAALPKGVYLLKVSSGNGSLQQFKKIIVE